MNIIRAHGMMRINLKLLHLIGVKALLWRANAAMSIANQQRHSKMLAENMTKAHFRVVHCCSSVHCVNKVNIANHFQLSTGNRTLFHTWSLIHSLFLSCVIYARVQLKKKRNIGTFHTKFKHFNRRITKLFVA